MGKKLTFLGIVSAIAGLLSANQLKAEELYTIGTAEVTGVYYPVGDATAQIVNNAHVGLNLVVESTGGSIFNIEAIDAQQLNLALAQSDIVYQAYNGKLAFEGKPVQKLRTIMGLHPEPTHLICNTSAGVNTFRDLAGKKVNLGNPGSGQLKTVIAMLEVFDMTEQDLQAEYLKPIEASDNLHNGKIDCFFYVIGIGATVIQDLISTTDVQLIPLDDPELATLIEQYPYYSYAKVPPGTYLGQDEELTLFGVKALFVTSTDLPEEDVYKIVKAILDHLDIFLSSHPALANLTADDLVQGFGAPLHPGAARAYREAGLLK